MLIVCISFNAWGLTMFDALDTMWIMGLDDYFHEAVGHISETSFALKEVRHIILVSARDSFCKERICPIL